MIKSWAVDTVQRMRGLDYKKRKEYLALTQLQNARELSQFQAKHMAELLDHANAHVPYYHRLLSERDTAERTQTDYHVLNQFPLLTRDALRNNFDVLQSDDIATRRWHINKSGGSTGEPVQFIHDDSYARWRAAANYYYYNHILGINEPRCKKVLLWGSPRDTFQGTIGVRAKVVNWLANTVLLNSFRMTTQDMERYINVINRYKPDLIRGYSGSLYELCRFAERKNLSLHQPEKLVCAAESLKDFMREKIESVFATKAFDFYGSREIANLAGECDAGLMHLFTFWTCVEIIDANKRPVSSGQEGGVVVTNLFNYAMPLLRYEIGDTAVLGPEKCPCGNILPTLERVTGRATDNFVLEDGTIIAGEFLLQILGVYCNKGQFKQFQAIQEDFKKIRINVVLDGRFDDADRRNVESKIRAGIRDCEITWHFFDEIPTTKSGKYEFVKSLVAT